MKNRIYLSSPHMSGHELKYIEEAFQTNWVAPLGKNVDELERELGLFIGRKNAVALSSGSAAIHLGLKALGVGKGDKVFCSDLTFSGSCNAIDYVGAIPIFIDCETETWNMSPQALEKAFKKHPDVKAVIIVNLYGNPAQFDELLVITKKHGVPVLEDAAESLGSKYKGVETGNFGNVSIFSFNGNKIITTSGGGMAFADTKDMRDKMLFWATQSREKFPWYQHEEIGYNYRLSNICAGIGRGQISALGDRIRRKGEIYRIYKECFSDNKYISLIPTPKDTEPNHWLSVLRVSYKSGVEFMDLVNNLSAENIESRPAWKPMHTQPVFKNCDYMTAEDGKSISEEIFSEGLCLPSDTKMTDDEVKFVAEIVNQAFIR